MKVFNKKPLKGCVSALILLLVTAGNSWAQQVMDYSGYTIQVVANTITGEGKSGSSISVDINGILNLPDSLSASLLTRPEVYLAYNSYAKEYVVAKAPLKARRGGFQVRFEASDRNFLNAVINPKNELYLVTAGDILFKIEDGGKVEETYQYSISSGSLKLKSAQTGIQLNEEQKRVILDALGGYQSVYYNSFDAGWKQADADTASNNAYIDFSFIKPVLGKIGVGASGLLSTYAEDPLAHVELKPFIISSRDNKWHAAGMYQTSLDGDDRRIAVQASYRTMATNFLDLTGGNPRLRLKPYINAGINAAYYTEVKDPQLAKEIVFEPSIKLFYHIPILEDYLLKLDVYAYTRGNQDLVFDVKNNTQWQGTFALGYGIGKNAKIVGKYSYGTSEITNETDEQLMFGLLLDLLNQ